MARYLVVTIVTQVLDNVAVTDERSAHTVAEANITLGADAKVVQKGITGSTVRSAATETNVSLTSKHHG